MARFFGIPIPHRQKLKPILLNGPDQIHDACIAEAVYYQYILFKIDTNDESAQ